MTRKRYTAEDIIGHRRTIEIETGKGLAVLEACRKLGITGANLLSVEARRRRLAGRSGETAQESGTRECPAQTPRRDLSLDNSILKEAAAGNFSARPDAEKRSGMFRIRSRCPNAGRVAWWGNVAPRSSIG